MEQSPFHRQPESASARSPLAPTFATFSTLMHDRRAIRIFDGTPIPESVVRECLELTMLTPSSSNLQPWEMHWVRDPELQRELVRALIGQPSARTASELIVCVARTATWRENCRRVLAQLKSYGNTVSAQNLRYYEVVCPDIYNQGRFGFRGFIKRLINRFVGLRRAIVRAPASLGEMKIWAVKSAAMACQTLLLSFQAAGYETCPMEGFDGDRVRKILKLPPDAVVVMAIAVGRRAYNGVVSPRVRLPSSDFIKEV